MSYDYEFVGSITVDEQALGDRLEACHEEFSAIWDDYGYFDDFTVEAEGSFPAFLDRLVDFVERWGDFIERMRIEAHGEDVGDHTLYSMRYGRVVAISGRIAYDQGERFL